MVFTETTRQRQPYLTAPAWQLKYIPKEHKKCSLVVYKYEWARLRECWVHFLSPSLYFDRMCTETQAAAIFEKWSFFFVLRVMIFWKGPGCALYAERLRAEWYCHESQWNVFVRWFRPKNENKKLFKMTKTIIRISNKNFQTICWRQNRTCKI